MHWSFTVFCSLNIVYCYSIRLITDICRLLFLLSGMHDGFAFFSLKRHLCTKSHITVVFLHKRCTLQPTYFVLSWEVGSVRGGARSQEESRETAEGATQSRLQSFYMFSLVIFAALFPFFHQPPHFHIPYRRKPMFVFMSSAENIINLEVYSVNKMLDKHRIFSRIFEDVESRFLKNVSASISYIRDIYTASIGSQKTDFFNVVNSQVLFFKFTSSVFLFYFYTLVTLF